MEKEKLPQYIERRKAKLYFRIIIPKELHHLYGKKREIRKSFRTEKLEEAKLLLPKYLAEAQNEFVAKRKGIELSQEADTAENEDMLSFFSEKELENLAFEYKCIQDREAEQANLYNAIQAKLKSKVQAKQGRLRT